jgi:integrase
MISLPTWKNNGWNQSTHNYMAVRKIGQSWWVDFGIDNARYRKRSPANSRAGAEAFEATLRGMLARGEPIVKATRIAHQEQTFEEFARRWFGEYVVPNNKYSEQRTKKYILAASLIPFFGKTLIEQIAVRRIEQYKAQAAREGVSNKTINNRLTVLKKCIGTAYEWLELEGAPPAIKWLKCPPPKVDHLSSEECERLLSRADGVVYELLLTALRTGMRQGELKGLQWSSINWDTRMLTVRHSQCDYTKELGSPKSNRERHIPMHDDVYEILHKRKGKGYVFVDVDGQPFDNKRLKHRLAAVCKKAELRHIGWHTLRHTFASHLATKGVPLNAVQALLGHSNITTTMRYAHLAPSTLRTAIDLLTTRPAASAEFRQPVVNEWFRQQQKHAA